MRNFFKIGSFFIFCVVLNSCRNKQDKIFKNVVWENFKLAIENKNLDYLVVNSTDDIICVDCVGNTKTKKYSNKFIYNNHLSKLYNTEIYKNLNYSIYESDSIIRITYNFQKLLGSESSMTVFTFKKENDKILFTEKIIVP